MPIHSAFESVTREEQSVLLPEATPLLPTEKPLSNSFSSPLGHSLCMHTVMFYMLTSKHTVVFQYPRGTGSRLPVGTKIHGCVIPYILIKWRSIYM